MTPDVLQVSFTILSRITIVGWVQELEPRNVVLWNNRHLSAATGGERGSGDGRYATSGHLRCSEREGQGQVYRPHQGETPQHWSRPVQNRFSESATDHPRPVSTEHAPELQTERVLCGPTARRVHLAARLLCGKRRLCRIHRKKLFHTTLSLFPHL